MRMRLTAALVPLGLPPHCHLVLLLVLLDLLLVLHLLCPLLLLEPLPPMLPLLLLLALRLRPQVAPASSSGAGPR